MVIVNPECVSLLTMLNAMRYLCTLDTPFRENRRSRTLELVSTRFPNVRVLSLGNMMDSTVLLVSALPAFEALTARVLGSGVSPVTNAHLNRHPPPLRHLALDAFIGILDWLLIPPHAVPPSSISLNMPEEPDNIARLLQATKNSLDQLEIACLPQFSRIYHGIIDPRNHRALRSLIINMDIALWHDALSIRDAMVDVRDLLSLLQETNIEKLMILEF